MNPIRMRIMQYLYVHEKATAGNLVEFISDVPRTTLYRHIKLLLENDILKVVSESRIRGTVERTYSVNIEIITKENTLENATKNVFGFLMNIYSNFDRYYSNENCNPSKDKIFLNTMTLLMSDDEFNKLLTDLNALFMDHLNNKPSERRKVRNLSIISAPNID